MVPGLPFVFLFIPFLCSFHQQWPKKLMLPVVLLTIGCCGAKQRGSKTLWGSPYTVRPNQVCHQLGMPPTLWLVLFAGKVYCTLCAVYLTPSSSALTQHCLGRLDKDGNRVDNPHTRKAKRLASSADASPGPQAPSLQPNIIINIPKQSREPSPEPRPKKQKDGTLDAFRSKCNKQEEFLRDLVLAFTSCNIPLEKLKVGAGGEKTLMRQFLDKYLNVEGKVPHIPDPVNLRGTYLPKVRDEGRTLPVTVMHSFL